MSPKIRLLRKCRDRHLVEVDIAVNQMILSNDFSDREAWAAYRQALLDITEPYKNGEPLDLAAVSWPTQPE